MPGRQLYHTIKSFHVPEEINNVHEENMLITRIFCFSHNDFYPPPKKKKKKLNFHLHLCCRLQQLSIWTRLKFSRLVKSENGQKYNVKQTGRKAVDIARRLRTDNESKIDKTDDSSRQKGQARRFYLFPYEHIYQQEYFYEILSEKEKMRVTTIFSFSSNGFNSSKNELQSSIYILFIFFLQSAIAVNFDHSKIYSSVQELVDKIERLKKRKDVQWNKTSC